MRGMFVSVYIMDRTSGAFCQEVGLRSSPANDLHFLTIIGRTSPIIDCLPVGRCERRRSVTGCTTFILQTSEYVRNDY